ncbi:hypothetical protein HD_1995 [[Haemophilus] ducreyi 35000HP]|uniref:Uncharacterized protein n=1 Tax=Haemophilus ducreyi (strain 35000HP / ATCC 700724) TaxID=233412 RepID=Q7VKC1_HAEDU|nr:hypothetical protein HD_1995 [[Haemophilus] ducreyi 35000HP]
MGSTPIHFRQTADEAVFSFTHRPANESFSPTCYPLK